MVNCKIKKVILFDLGNTLVEYYYRDQWKAVVEETIGEVCGFLKSKDLLTVSPEVMWQNIENHRADRPDYRVIPLSQRLSKVFKIADNQNEIMDGMCRAFLKPIFARGRIYNDTLDCLRHLRNKGFRLGIVSNTPWGSSGDLWREELKRLGLFDMVDQAIFCTDTGFRKPARQIFDYTLAKFNAAPDECIFIGDDIRWDVEGPQNIGMDAILIDRQNKNGSQAKSTVHNLAEFVKLPEINNTEGAK